MYPPAEKYLSIMTATQFLDLIWVMPQRDRNSTDLFADKIAKQ